MSKIDYQALREAAEKATWGDWNSYKPHRGARGYEVRLSSQAIAQHVLKNNAEFIAAFNPKVALALLDERERNQQYIKRRDQENEDIALTVGKLRVELEAAENNLIDSECHVAELEEALRDKQALLEASEKRIAELEAREILLPERSSMLHRTDFHDDYQTVMAYKVSEVIDAIRATGIRIKGE
ncbi:TPA: ead/Ea22-like family protein [Escherichia coli]|nr:ead/Ea22-like family protein [Escherichia coli]HCY3238051.1 ead/Ea22-like family protein [Escherichia coli]HCY3253058.1 ead/Ea22-like family protein [Escherichia coli]HCY3314054.1 ead/Ea22-like family protein [Escherichia coli]HCY3362124.1 ead/Ea22-like family protein [Escherichia coli]